MRISCPQCRRIINVPDDKAENPNLKVKCAGCAAIFPFQEASLVLKEPDPPAAPAAPAAPVRPAAPGAGRAVPPSPSRPAAPVRPSTPPGSATPPRPAAAAAPGPSVSRTAPSTSPGGGAAPGEAPPSARPRPPSPTALRRCANHPQARAANVCPACQKGFCTECGKPVGSAVLCPVCEGLCTPAAKFEEGRDRDRQRARSMGEEIGTILGYPFVDKVAYVLLALFTWFFAVVAKFGGGGYAVVFSQGVLMAYSFSALSKVSGGNLKHYMPDFSDISDLVTPLRLGFAALIISLGPLVAVAMIAVVPSFLTPLVSVQAVNAQEPEPESSPPPETGSEEGEEGAQREGQETAPSFEGGEERPPLTEEADHAPLWVIPAVLLALLWKVVYTPVALIVAGVTRSFWQTLNPILGAATIFRMGGTYWAAAAIYTVIVAIQWAVSYPLRMVPVGGSLVIGFIDAYVYLAIGCTLGLAVFKKAKELDLE